ncbi:MAG: hypothetical protein U1E56_06660 [Bauldia sp.]
MSAANAGLGQMRLTMTLAAFLAATAAAAQAPQAAAPEHPAVKTFATLPSAAGTENLCQAADGAFYITLIDDHKLLKVTADGAVSEFAAPAAAHLLGVACGEREIATVAFAKPFRKPNPAGQGTLFDFGDTDTHIVVYDSAGKVTADIPAKKGVGFNGLAYAGRGLYYATDSASGGLYRIDVAAKSVDLWYDDAASAPGKDSPIGVNGIKVKNGWVYYSSFPRNGVFKLQLGADGKPQGGPVKVEEGIRVDDFDVASDGSLYFTTGPVLYRVSAAGEVSKLAEPVQGGPSAQVGADGNWVYWPTRGGTAPQRLVRVAIP